MTNVGSSTVSVINNATLSVVATIGVSKTPWHVTITPDGAWAYVSNTGNRKLSIINTSTHAVVKTLTVGAGTLFLRRQPERNRALRFQLEGHDRIGR